MAATHEIVELVRNAHYLSIPLSDAVPDAALDDFEYVTVRAECPVCHHIYRITCPLATYAYLRQYVARDIPYEEAENVEKFWIGCAEHGIREEAPKPRRRKPAYRR